MGMNAPATIVHWGFLFITVPNLIVIAVLMVVFAAALALPFPHGRDAFKKEHVDE